MIVISKNNYKVTSDIGTKQESMLRLRTLEVLDAVEGPKIFIPKPLTENKCAN